MFTNQVSKIFIVLLVLAVAVVTASFVVRSTPSAADLSSDVQIENVRLQRSFSLIDASYNNVEQARFSRALAAYNSGYDQIENIRAQRTFAPAAADSSYNLVENVRLERGLVADRSYDNIEAIRLLR
jgi:PDZ domain-containing secreted protein